MESSKKFPSLSKEQKIAKELKNEGLIEVRGKQMLASGTQRQPAGYYQRIPFPYPAGEADPVHLVKLFLINICTNNFSL